MWAVTHYGYLAMFLLLALGIVGLPIPDEALMVLVGSMTVEGPLQYIHAFLVCFSGSFVGMLVSYTVGRKVGKPLIERYGAKIKLTPARLARVEGWFAKYGLFSIIFGYFIPGVRHLTCYFAGMSRLNFSLYLIAAIVGNIIWVGTFLTVGHMVGVHWETTVMWINTQWRLAMWTGCLLLLMAVASVWIWRKKKRIIE